MTVADTPAASDPAARSLLGRLFPAHRVRERLLSREAWRPFPHAPDREGWAQLAADIQARS